MTVTKAVHICLSLLDSIRTILRKSVYNQLYDIYFIGWRCKYIATEKGEVTTGKSSRSSKVFPYFTSNLNVLFTHSTSYNYCV